MTLWLFTATVFTGSSLLFLVQPMFARLVLPHLGGSPSVWTTCMLFFQAVLLLGYLYAHLSMKALPVRTHAIAHLLVLTAPLVVLPIAVASPDAVEPESPTRWLLMSAAVSVGLPFFAVATSAPLLQRWFATLPHPSARDPYFLYAASNLGSMLALLSYPFLVEPLLGLTSQSEVWAWIYGAFALLTAGCALAVRAYAQSGTTPTAVADAAPLSWPPRLLWLSMAFIPSTLMLGVTAHISTDIAAVPLLWVVPLALYLLTFVIAFAPRTKLQPNQLATIVGILAFATLVSVLLNAHQVWYIGLHLLTFASAALLCHLRLARARPDVSRLTEFYIWLSIGGVLGGVFNSVIAPVIFSTVLEYPLALVSVILTATALHRSSKTAPTSLKWGLTVAAVALILTSAVLTPLLPVLNLVVLVGSITLAGLTIVERRNIGLLVRASAIVALICVVSTGRARMGGTVLHTERSFFGVHRVIEAPDGMSRRLYHGSTVHGWQMLPVAGCEVSSYYAPGSPISDIFAAVGSRFVNAAVIGLGTGALACYAQVGDSWTFYEIDEAVHGIASSTAYFSHLANSAGNVNVVIADGRLGLQSARPGSYDLVILDAFSSDSIPVHLLTREAMQLYFSRLAPRGIVIVHISNRYLQLEPALAALGRDLGLQGYARSEGGLPEEDIRAGRTPSHWVVLARTADDIPPLDNSKGWHALTDNPAVPVWTDDYSNVLQALLLK